MVAEEFPLGEKRIVRIGAQIRSALAEAHAQGIIHRDLKPENVMVEPRRDEADFVKVLDFGIAKITAAEFLYGVCWAGVAFISPATQSEAAHTFIFATLIVVISMRVLFASTVKSIVYAGTLPMTLDAALPRRTRAGITPGRECESTGNPRIRAVSSVGRAAGF